MIAVCAQDIIQMVLRNALVAARKAGQIRLLWSLENQGIGSELIKHVIDTAYEEKCEYTSMRYLNQES